MWPKAEWNLFFDRSVFFRSCLHADSLGHFGFQQLEHALYPECLAELARQL
jgi:hypothetical protein